MTYIELYEIVEKLTYKTGTSFVLKPHVDLAHGEGAKLAIIQVLPNAKAPFHLTEIRLIKTIPSSKLRRMDVMEFMSWLHDALLAMETHELNEWLKLDGMTLFDPHPENALIKIKPHIPGALERLWLRWKETA